MSEDQIVRLAYFGLLGAFIMAGVLYSYRDRLGMALRDGLIWAIVILALVALYGLKDVVEGGLFPNRPITGEDGQITLRRAAGGEFRALLDVNGASIDFIVDTGASTIVLSRDDAETAGIDPWSLVYGDIALTANGPVRTSEISLDSVSLGGIVDTDVPASVNEGEMPASLLGRSYLDRFRYYKVEGDLMTLVR